jgi:photosystem II stability/assembly factor-like uncharacterized protein
MRAQTAWSIALLASLVLIPMRVRAETEMDAGEDVETRMEARRMRRLDGEGGFAADAVLRAKRELDARTPLRTSDAGISAWEWLGPGNIGGRVRALVIHPTNPLWMWAGTAGGGIWRTTNGGSSWFAMSDFLPSLAVASMAIDPINPTILYAGTGEMVGSYRLGGVPMPTGAGIFKSTTSGLLWTQLASTNTPDFDYVSHLEHHPVISSRLLAGTRTGVWYSKDGGNTWNHIFTPPDGRAVRDVKYHPTHFDTIAVGTELNMYLLRLDPAADTVSWASQTTGDAGKMPANLGDCVIQYARSNTNILYVSAGNDMPIVNDMSDWIYRSTNGGKEWSRFIRTNADRWSNALWVSPTDANLVVWGGFGDLFRTTGGPIPVPISDGAGYDAGTSAHTDQHQIVTHPGFNGGNNLTVFFANDGGVQKTDDVLNVSTNSGWTNLANGLGCSQFFGASISRDGTTLAGGMQDMGSAASHTANGPQGWSYVSGGDGGFSAVNPNNPQQLFVTGATGWVGRSDNGGATWAVQKTNGIFGPGQGNEFDFLAPLVMDPNNSNVLLLGGIMIWRTFNSADNWTKMRDSLPGNPRCTAIDIAPSNSNVVWVGYSNGLVSHTEDGGAHWTDHAIPGTRFVTDIAINPFAWNEVVATLSGNATDNVWLTNTTGASWQRRTGLAPHDLPAIQVNTVRYHPLMPNWIYVGTDLGVFGSEDKGLNWSITPAFAGNEGPNNVEVEELFWQGTSYLLAATHGRGIYRCKPLPIVYVDKAHVGFEDGTELFPYNTVSEAVSAYGSGAIVSIKAATYDEPPLTISKRGVVRATGGGVRIH